MIITEDTPRALNDNYTFEGYEGKYVIVYYIAHDWIDNVFMAFDTLESATVCMDILDLWEDWFIYYIADNGFAYAPQF